MLLIWYISLTVLRLEGILLSSKPRLGASYIYVSPRASPRTYTDPNCELFLQDAGRASAEEITSSTTGSQDNELTGSEDGEDPQDDGTTRAIRGALRGGMRGGGAPRGGIAPRGLMNGNNPNNVNSRGGMRGGMRGGLMPFGNPGAILRGGMPTGPNRGGVAPRGARGGSWALNPGQPLRHSAPSEFMPNNNINPNPNFNFNPNSNPGLGFHPNPNPGPGPGPGPAPNSHLNLNLVPNPNSHYNTNPNLGSGPGPGSGPNPNPHFNANPNPNRPVGIGAVPLIPAGARVRASMPPTGGRGQFPLSSQRAVPELNRSMSACTFDKPTPQLPTLCRNTTENFNNGKGMESDPTSPRTMSEDNNKGLQRVVMEFSQTQLSFALELQTLIDVRIQVIQNSSWIGIYWAFGGFGAITAFRTFPVNPECVRAIGTNKPPFRSCEWFKRR